MNFEYSFDYNRLKSLFQIGEGPFSDVYIVKNEESGHFFASKIYRQKIEENEDTSKKILKETERVSKLKHPLLSKFYGLHRNSQNVIIISDFQKNCSLTEFLDSIKNGKSGFQYDDTCKLINIYGIAHAMSFLHSNKIIHAHLCPNNIFIDDEFNPIITDFLLSRLTHRNIDELMNEKNKNSMVYLAPEIFSKSKFTKESNVYSFAMIVFKILSGNDPFCDETYQEIIQKVSQGIRPEFNFQISESYRSLIEKCWSQEPSERPTFDEILSQLENDKGFITEDVKKKQYSRYMKLLDDKIIFLEKLKHKKKGKAKSQEVIATSKNEENENEKKLRRSSIDITLVTHEKEEAESVIPSNSIGLNSHDKDDNEPSNKIETISPHKQRASSPVYLITSQQFNRINKNKARIAASHLPQRSQLAALADLQKQKYKPMVIIKTISDERKRKEELENIMAYVSTPKDDSKSEENNEQSDQTDENSSSSDDEQQDDQDDDDKQEEQIDTSSTTNDVKKDDDDKQEEQTDTSSTTNDVKKDDDDKNENMKRYKSSNELKEVEPRKDIAKIQKERRKTQDPKIASQIKEKSKGDKSEYIKKLKKKIKAGNPKSMLKYAKMLYNGNGIEVNKSEALKYYKKAANKEVLEAIVKCGKMYIEGDGVKKSKSKALPYFKKAAFKDDLESIYQCGIILYNRGKSGKGKKTDMDDAISYLKQAAMNGHIEGMIEYAKQLIDGKYVDENITNKKRASEYLYKAMGQSNEAIYLYAKMVYDGDGIAKDIKKGEELLKLAADKGNVKAMFEYAVILAKGIYVKKNLVFIEHVFDKKGAAEYYKMAADNGHAESMYRYSLFLGSGEMGLKMDKKMSAEYCKKAADKGHNKAMYYYSLKLESGDGIDVDEVEAAKYCKLAADKGNINAILKYAKFLLNGKGVKQNKEEAKKYYKKAAKENNEDAMYELSKISREEEYVYEDEEDEEDKYFNMALENGQKDAAYEKAIEYSDGFHDEKRDKYFKIAADNGHVEAMYQYASILRKNNNPKAIDYFKNASDNGHPGAMNDYALIIVESHDEKNYDKAARLLKIAASHGYEAAILNYAHLLLKGIGTQKNVEEAIKFFKQSAENGYVEAMKRLASLYDKGKVVDVNKTEAAKYYKMAADLDDVESMCMYGLKLINGDGVKPNYKLAEKYLKKTIANGDINKMSNKDIKYLRKNEKEAINKAFIKAHLGYAKLFDEGLDVKKNKKKAAEYVKKIADRGHIDSMFDYANRIYYDAELKDQKYSGLNKKEAAKYYKLAADNGHKEAALKYALMLREGDGVYINKDKSVIYMRKYQNAS